MLRLVSLSNKPDDGMGKATHETWTDADETTIVEKQLDLMLKEAGAIISILQLSRSRIAASVANIRKVAPERVSFTKVHFGKA